MESLPGKLQHRANRLGSCATIAASALLLSGCLHLQLGGAVTEATVTVTPLRDFGDVVERLETPSVEEVRQERGPDNWDQKRDIGRFIFLGNVVLDESRYDPETLYLVTASGGLDQDADSNNVMDQEPTRSFGQWHAIMTGEQLSRGKVSPLTEAVYRYLELNLAPNEHGEEESEEKDEVLGTIRRDAPSSVEEIAARCGLGVPDLLARLGELELHGRVVRLPGPLFVRS